ncbi:uncharacterized protein RHO25_010391 [Cercospora beticola]|uniref:Uncharacterized protein n=1 Tax=Cercospora beticola TaxID=122368 RepID=A0ABZ0P1K6_CERBT|nr:hypothetical protein RHO25_010391 [Cercospora beticola]
MKLATVKVVLQRMKRDMATDTGLSGETKASQATKLSDPRAPSPSSAADSLFQLIGPHN